MTSKNWDDLILPFQLDSADIRGRIVRLDRTLDAILAQHNYPETANTLLVEAVMITALIGQTIKLRWKLSLQIRGDGPIRLIATDYYSPDKKGAPARIRAYASVDKTAESKSKATAFEKLGKGMFAILIDQGSDMEPYKGITPLYGGSLAACAETYFAQSEQLPTRFNILTAQSRTAQSDTMKWRAGGIMLQHMPMASPLLAHDSKEQENSLLSAQDLLHDDAAENWNRANILLDSVEEVELVGPHITTPKLLLRLFNQEQPRIFTAQPIEFGCTCSADKVRFTMSIYNRKEIAYMTAANGMLTADCQFCGQHYELDPTSLGRDATETS